MWDLRDPGPSLRFAILQGWWSFLRPTILICGKQDNMILRMTNSLQKTVLLFEKPMVVSCWGFGCFLVGVLVFCLSCGCVSASPSGECMLWFVERTGANLGFAPQLAVKVALPKCWFYFPWESLSFLCSSGLAALAVWVFPRNLQCLPAGLRVSPPWVGSSRGFWPTGGEGLQEAEVMGRVGFPAALVELTCGLFHCDLWIICPQVSL